MTPRPGTELKSGSVALETLVDRLVKEYLSRNAAARVVKADLDRVGIGLKPVLDHITIRTMDIDRRAQEFVGLGYVYAETIEYHDWFAKVYRARGFPALFVDQGYSGERGKSSLIPGWVAVFGDETLHHVAVQVEDIELAIQKLQAQGVVFAGQVVGDKGGLLRQIFTIPEQVNGQPFSVLELAERHGGYQGFSPPHADNLMRSTVGSR